MFVLIDVDLPFGGIDVIISFDQDDFDPAWVIYDGAFE